MSKIFSPSSTATFLACRVKWMLYRKGWIAKTYGKNTLYAIRGSAVSAGLDVFAKTASEESSLLAVKDSVLEEWKRSRVADRQFQEFKSLPLSVEEITAQAQCLVGYYIENPPTAFKILHSEYIFKNHGNARADVIASLNPSGDIVPVDYKVRDVPFNSYYKYTTKQDFRYSHQMYHYCMAVSQEFNVNCLQFGILILWFDKRPSVEYIPFSVEPERLKLWYQSATVVWAQMAACEAGEESYTEAANHRDQYGPCEYSKMCLEHNRNYNLATQDYIRIDK